MRRQAGSKILELSVAKKFFAIFLFSAILVGTGYTGLSSVQAAASPARIVAYQGRLLNNNGVPVSDASLPMIFTLYTALSGGTCVWSNNSSSCTAPAARTVSLTAGLFSENLGDTTASYAAINSTVFSDNASIYLEIIVNGETLAPRKLMSASPYALNTDTVDGFDTSSTGATTGVVPVTDANGNLIITGSPVGSGVSQGSLFINPASGVVSADEILLGVAVNGASRFVVDAEGDSTFLGVVGAADFACADCIGFGALKDTSSLDAILQINMGAFDITTNGTGALSFLNTGAADFAGNLNANGGLDVTTANLTVGGANFSVTPGTGNVITAGDVGVNGGDITSSAGLTISTASNGITLNPFNSLVNTATGDGLAIGSSSLVAPFSVDASSQTIRFGSGATNDPILNFFANDGVSTASITFNAADQFTMNGASFAQTGIGAIPSNSNGTTANFSSNNTITGTSGSNLQALKMFGGLNGVNYSAIEGSGTTSHEMNSTQSSLNISGGTATITTGSGVKGSIFNSSTNNNLIETGGYLAGVVGLVTHNAAGTTVARMAGLRGEIVASNGTISEAVGAIAAFVAGAGTVTNATGFTVTNTTVGTNRYGFYADVSGGTANFAGYFTGSRVQVDSDTTPDAPGLATGAGDLFVSDAIEADGSVSFGDTGGGDVFTFTSGVSSGVNILSLVANSITDANGMVISRADGAGAFSGRLLSLQQNDTSGAAGRVLEIISAGSGPGTGLYIVQNTTEAHSGVTTSNSAMVIDINENGSADDAMMLRSDANNDGSGTDTEFRITSQGDTFMDGVMTSASVAVGGADYAEFFQTTDSSLSGSELVCQDATNTVKRCEAGNTNVMGVISTNPGVMGNVFVEDYRDILANPGYRLVGMLGQIDVSVTAASGAIAVGDPITTSSTAAGYGAKAHGPVRILGFALEPLASGVGTVRVMVQPQWYGGDVLTRSGSATQVAGSFAIASSTAATASIAAVNSASLQLRGSAWDAGSAQDVSMSLQTSINAINDYRLSVMNTSGTEVASVNGLGDLAISGKFYPSDRGASQSSKYIYYDGSSGSGGDFMRTNASGWGTGSYDFAEMFPSPDSLVAGEVVVFGDASEQVKRAGGETYNPKIAGIVSTRPGFLAGTNTPGSVPVALAGRVPTFVSSENGPINIGDPVTTSSRAGYAMKATEAGPIVGYAAEAFSGSTGSIVVYVNVSYYAGTPVDEGPATANTISHLAQDIENFDTAGVLNINGGQLLAIGSMTSASGAWHLSETGDLVTSGRLIQLVRGNDGTNVETYPATSRDMTVQLTGTTILDHGAAIVHFADIDSSFTNIIDSNPSYRVLVTPYGATGTLYVTNRTVDGFSIAESGAASNGVSVDWMVIAYRRDYAPVATPVVIPAAAPIIVPIVTGDAGGATTDDAAVTGESSVVTSDSTTDSDVPASDTSESVDTSSGEPVVPSDSESVPVGGVETAPVVDPGSDAPSGDAPSPESAVSSDGAATSDSGSSAPESAPSSDSVAQ